MTVGGLRARHFVGQQARAWLKHFAAVVHLYAAMIRTVARRRAGLMATAELAAERRVAIGVERTATGRIGGVDDGRGARIACLLARIIPHSSGTRSAARPTRRRFTSGSASRRTGVATRAHGGSRARGGSAGPCPRASFWRDGLGLGASRGEKRQPDDRGPTETAKPTLHP